MHDFKYKADKLYCENVLVEEIVSKVGTPCYIYSKKTLLDHYNKLKSAFREVKPLICFSVKANSNLAVCGVLVDAGSGLDIVSGGELYRAKKVGVDPKKIVYASVGKTAREITDAIKYGILFFNVESIPELEMINLISGRLGKKTQVCVRINPDIDPKTHKFISTGKKENKFGLDFETVRGIFQKRSKYQHVSINGIHVHIGSQITSQTPFVESLTKVTTFIRELEDVGITLKYLNIGGGLGIIYKDETPQSAVEFATGIIPILKKTGLKIIMEPGRFIAGNSGILVTRVTYIKKTKIKNFVIVDSGMNDLIRPCLYHAYHEIASVTKDEKKPIVHCDVVGPICESSDFLAKDVGLRSPQAGDLLVCMSAGAYGFSMSSNYNSRPRACEVMVDKNKFHIIRKRENYADLIKSEKVLKS